MDQKPCSPTEVRPNREIILLSEPVSRFGDFGEMLPVSAVTNDGLCRIIVDQSFSGYTLSELRQANLPTYPQIVGMAIQRLCPQGGRCWCVGQIKKRSLFWLQGFASLRATLGSDISHVTVGPEHILVAYCLRIEQIQERTEWPMYDGDNGFRVFAFVGAEAILEQTFRMLEQQIQKQSIVALDMWADLCSRCQRRSELAYLCSQAYLVVSPDGPHCTEAALHSLRLSAPEVTSSIFALAQDYGYMCTIIENRNEEYKLLHH